MRSKTSEGQPVSPRSRGYTESVRLMRRLDDLMARGLSESEEANAVRDEMDTPWLEMTTEERVLLDLLSVDLYSLWDSSGIGYLEEFDHKYNNRQKTDLQIVEAAIGNMEGRRVTLFKTKSGEGDSLIETKQGEKREHGTKRGSSEHERTGKKKAAPPSVAASPSEQARKRGARGAGK